MAAQAPAAILSYNQQPRTFTKVNSTLVEYSTSETQTLVGNIVGISYPTFKPFSFYDELAKIAARSPEGIVVCIETECM